ncbi:MAG TPA: universal stress protein [Myxococcaceae bacterium]|nr:universal stress protein [Myxococcaceae bacterium]
MRKILVGVDGSEPSVHAARMAAELASRTGARLVLAYAIFPNLLSPTVYPDLVKQLEQDERAQANKALDDVIAKAELAALNPERLISMGAAAEVLADAAEADKDVWMVVVGSYGRTATMRVLVGSVADRLIHICKKPVLVVR